MRTDNEYYAAFLEGDIEAFESLVLHHRHSLVCFLLQYTESYETAEDIAQEVFAYLYVHPERYRSQYGFKTFLYTLAKRRAIDSHRRRRVPTENIDDLALADRRSLEEIVFRREEERELYRALGQLKEDYRRILLLCELDGFSLAEAAKILGKSPAAAKVLAHRARKALKNVMEKGAI